VDTSNVQCPHCGEVGNQRLIAKVPDDTPQEEIEVAVHIANSFPKDLREKMDQIAFDLLLAASKLICEMSKEGESNGET